MAGRAEVGAGRGLELRKEGWDGRVTSEIFVCLAAKRLILFITNQCFTGIFIMGITKAGL